MLDVTLLTLAAILQGDAGVLPANPVTPLGVASSGTAAVTARLGGLFVNPSNAIGTRGVEFGLVSYPRTGLEGFSVVAVGGGQLKLLAGLWSYALSDIFDQGLVEEDPSLRELGMSMAAGSAGAAIRFGNLGIGSLFTARSQNIVGTHASSASLSLGSRLDIPPFEFAASVVDVPVINRHGATAPSPSTWLGVAANWTVSALVLRFEADGRFSELDGVDYGVSPRIGWGPFEMTWGYSSRQGWSGGAGVKHRRLRFDAAMSFVGNQRLDQQVALSLSYQ